ncbi:peptide/nickel transport system substrate-binding protein [Kibdelosporangium banguiense]|uniref:Peptide/nickel transport system substrate-binding protein n=1 Tax=Kibdelosporangium banguiense TaxID=1365924 RepID=A0ABS4TJ75_9PSEU|nr:ABC transporter substrate-binding protein [Kibdelosporangium banguiense]MBP2324065.1 peptide/nickel transport system substrate-binding protein [Kibdelosporangium banguiense]
MPARRPFLMSAALLALPAVLVGCTAAPTLTASGSTDSTSLVLAVPNEPLNVHPLAGYGQHGAAKVFDGLLEHQADLSVRPALAVELPTPSADGKSWTVKLRGDVRFQDGSAFDGKDVEATYRALLDPAYASPLRSRYSVITGVTEVTPPPTTTTSAPPTTSSRVPQSTKTVPVGSTVRFDLAQPYAPFPDLLVLGIVPSETLTQPANVASLKPVGTGPYQLEEWKRGESMTLRANSSYFGGAPTVAKVTIEFIPDDAARVQRVRDGKLDSAALPPAQAKSFENSDVFAVLSQRSAGVRTVRLPAANPVTSDPQIRLALNYAVNRRSMIDGPLAGRGTEAYTPMSPVLAEYFEPSAKFSHDVPTAKSFLDTGGWVTGSDGIRTKNGVPARFSLVYPAGDTVSRDLATAFAADADAVGIQVSTSVGAPTPADAAIISVGDPFDPDLALYPLLHDSDTKIATPLEAARATTDPAQRAVEYRKMQRTYVESPSMVVLAGIEHTYVLRRNWTGYQAVVDADTQDGTWGAWWNLSRWQPR